MSDSVLTTPNPVECPDTSDALLNEEERGFTRKGFVKIAIGGVGLAYAAAIGYPIYRYLNSPVEKFAAMAAVKEV
ncbi:MAG: hypothetical protein NZ557_08400, partial [Chthonomonadaceae bacterium]|nr:hypothetical protein [Chthonomonadaceae bacterium]